MFFFAKLRSPKIEPSVKAYPVQFFAQVSKKQMEFTEVNWWYYCIEVKLCGLMICVFLLEFLKPIASD